MKIIQPERQRELLADLKAVMDSEERAMEANDWTAYRALAEKEARIMDELKVFFDAQREEHEREQQ